MMIFVFVVMAAAGLKLRSESSALRPWTDFGTHAMGMAAGVVICLLPPRRLFAFMLPGCLVVLVLLVLASVPGISQRAYGATRWVLIAGVTFQPSELLKPAMVLSGAAWPAIIRSGNRFKSVLVGIVLSSGAIGLVARQPDFATAGILMVIYWTGLTLYNRRVAFVALLPTLSFVAVAAVGSPHVTERVKAFVHAEESPLGSGYQMIQSRRMLANARWWGRPQSGSDATAASTPRIPSATRDFALVGIVRQFGLGFALICLGGLLVAPMFRFRAESAGPPFEQRLATIGLAALYSQIALNSFAVTGLFPIAGVPFPFFSGGGTSTVSTWLILALTHRGLLRRSRSGSEERISGPPASRAIAGPVSD